MIWLIGNRGMLGTDIELKLKANGLEYAASDLDVDITNIDALRNYTKDKMIEWIVNCSAYTAVDKAEDDPDKAFKINADGVENIAKIAKEKKTRLIHFSTDYVFNGEKPEAYLENDKTDPIGIYGKSKLKGEEYILRIIPEHFIFRISWLYGQHGANFVHTMLRLFSELNEIRVVDDQWGSPTFTKDVASVILKIIQENNSAYGIYNFTNDGKITWYEFAHEILKLAKERSLVKKNISIIPVTTAEYPTKAVRPKNSYLSKDKIKNTLGIEPRPWQDALREFLDSK